MKQEFLEFIEFLKTEGGLDTIFELIKQADVFKPIVGAAVAAIVNYGPEFKQLIESLRLTSVENRIVSVKQYEAAGFDRDDAILMTLDSVAQIKDAIYRANAKGSK